jgi:hypothetical protein
MVPQSSSVLEGYAIRKERSTVLPRGRQVRAILAVGPIDMGVRFVPDGLPRNYMTNLKTCQKCRVERTLDRFSSDRSERDGKQRRCKSCKKNDRRVYAILHRDRIRETRRRWRAKHGHKWLPYFRKYYREHKKQIKAKSQLTYAIKMGRAQRGDHCQMCLSTGRLHGHHRDYSKPLEVIWLCAVCHKETHLR